MKTKTEIQEMIFALLTQLAEDWEYSEEITTETYLFSELGFQSLDAVILGNSLQEQLDQPIPYSDLLIDIGQRSLQDVTIGEWVDFTCSNYHKVR